MNEIKRRAMKALNKPAPYGPDVDIKDYEAEIPEALQLPLEELPQEMREKAEMVGIDVNEKGVGATYLQIDHSVAYTMLRARLKRKGIIVMSTAEALRRLPWVAKYYWKLIPVDTDKYTATVEIHMRHGYFIYVPPGVKVDMPVQACILARARKGLQPIHNIVIVGEGSELNLVTGCATTSEEGLHIGVSEFYVKKGGRLTFTMIHGWGAKYHARPRTAVLLEEGAIFASYYINLYPVRSLQAFPIVYAGKNASCYLTNIILGRGESVIDIGGGVVLRGEKATGEVISRSIIKDRARVIMRGRLVGETERIRGHLECRGLLLSPEAYSRAIPELEALAEGAELTHEAAIGKISEDELNYLMSKGFSEEEAVSLIVRGFLEVGLERLPQAIREPLKIILDMVARMARG